MGKLADYIEKLKQKINQKGDLNDIEKLRYIYIDLGRKLDFDLNYTFGNKRAQSLIYNRNITEDEFSHILETHTSICKGMSYLFERIAKEFGLKVNTVRVDYGNHVHNTFFYNGKTYILDLEDDLEYIQTGAKTHKFLIAADGKGEPLVSDEELRIIDTERVDYIPHGYYFDDMVWMLKKAISGKELSLDDRLKFVLDNIDVYCDMSHVKYRERIRFNERIFEEVFSKHELNKIHRVDCEKKLENGEKIYQSVIILEVPHSSNSVYIQDLENNKYYQSSMEELGNMINEGLTPKQGIPGVRKFLKRGSNKQINLSCKDDGEAK